MTFHRCFLYPNPIKFLGEINMYLSNKIYYQVLPPKNNLVKLTNVINQTAQLITDLKQQINHVKIGFIKKNYQKDIRLLKQRLTMLKKIYQAYHKLFNHQIYNAVLAELK